MWEALSNLQQYLHNLPLGEIRGDVSPQAYLVNAETIFIGEGTVVEPGAYIKGPCYIGKKCQVRHGAYIRGDLLAGDGCVIGHATEVKNAIFLNRAAAGHFAYVGDSILGNQVNLGAGVKCANLKLGGQEIVIADGAERIATGLRKLGCIAGDGAQLGCNVVTNPGTFLGRGCRCYPCTAVGGIVPARSLVKPGAPCRISPLKQ